LGLLCLLVLAVYYPSLYAGYNSVDDLKMIAWIDAAGPVNVLDLFFPQGNLYYYRPLVILTFFLDRDAWGAIPSFMHLENTLLHLGCVLLVYAVARQLARLYKFDGELIPLSAAALFAVHPVATEAVCWISGRTDPLAGFFVLLTVWLLLRGLAAERSWPILLSAPALLFACLAKEVAVFALPGLFWLVLFFPQGSGDWWRRLCERSLALLAPAVAVTVYFGMRSLALASDTGVSTAVKGAVGGSYDLIDKMRVALKVYGFYLKKVFIPWPLNFAINGVHPWYLLLGIVLAALLIWCVLRRDLLGSFGLLAFCVLSPALLIVFGQMAWTPVSERYLYIPAALLAPVAVMVFWQWRSRTSPAWQGRFTFAFIGILLVFFVTTLHRVWIWQDNLRLYRDTVTQSPDFAPARNELASVLRRQGLQEEARQLLETVNRQNAGLGYVSDDINLAKILVAKGEEEQASAILRRSLDPSHKKYHDILQELIFVNDKRWLKASAEGRQSIDHESLAWLHEQQRIRPSTFTLYRIGKQHMRLGDLEQATAVFRQVYNQAPSDAYYREPARKLMEKFEAE
jgi:tetratricopeptide (TPR) repeat protein